MTYYPTFAVLNPAKAPFDLQGYEEMFEEVERTDRPEAFPLSAQHAHASLRAVLFADDKFAWSWQSTPSATSISTGCCSPIQRLTSSTSTASPSCR